jgi:hypothetical protein
MKHQWQLLAVGAALAVCGCTDSAPSTSPEPARVPAIIAVPNIAESLAGPFAVDGHGVSRMIEPDNPDTGDETCFDVCDGSGGGDTSGGTSGGTVSDDEPRFQGPYFTEAHFEQGILKGHAESTFLLADHAMQNMTLTVSRQDGSALGSQKFTTGRIWPAPILIPATLVTDGSIPAPECGARGQGITVHDISSNAKGYLLGSTVTSQSTIMNQSQCPTTRTTTETTATSGGQIRVCLRLDHYSSTGKFIYTETVYCYYIYAS